MTRVALKGLWGRKLRTVLTALAIVLGVAMISGTYILTDTITASFTSVVDGSYENADAVVSGKVAFKNNDSATATTPAFPDSVLADVKQLPDVAAAAGTISDEAKLLDRDGKVISTKGGASIAASVDPANDARFNPLKLTTGKWPVGNGQIAIDQRTSEKQHSRSATRSASPRTRASVFRDHGHRDVRVRVLDRRVDDRHLRRPHRAAALPEGREVRRGPGRGQAGRDAGEARERDPAAPAAHRKVEDGGRPDAGGGDDVNAGVGIFQKILLAFGFIALFVGAFVIANTLSITIAQRMREFATLRTIGGSRRQVLRSVCSRRSSSGSWPR